MLTSKQRAFLRGIASTEDTIFQIGKGGISDALIKQVNDAIKAREIVKIKVLDNSGYTAKQAAEELALKTETEVVQVIGNKLVLYKRNDKEPVIKFK